MRSPWTGAQWCRAAPRGNHRHRVDGTSSSAHRAASPAPTRCCILGSVLPVTNPMSAGLATSRSRSCATPTASLKATSRRCRSPGICRGAPSSRWSMCHSANGPSRSPIAPTGLRGSCPTPGWSCFGTSPRSSRHTVTRYILGRLLATVPVMVVVTVFVFFLLRIAPGDPAAIIAGEDATVEAIGAMRAKLGLDRPVLEQFGLWLLRLAPGDLGASIFSNLPVTRLIAQRLEPTVALMLSTPLVAVPPPLPLGALPPYQPPTLINPLPCVF